jgi:hypothetical protein
MQPAEGGDQAPQRCHPVRQCPDQTVNVAGDRERGPLQYPPTFCWPPPPPLERTAALSSLKQVLRSRVHTGMAVRCRQQHNQAVCMRNHTHGSMHAHDMMLGIKSGVSHALIVSQHSKQRCLICTKQRCLICTLPSPTKGSSVHAFIAASRKNTTDRCLLPELHRQQAATGCHSYRSCSSE